MEDTVMHMSPLKDLLKVGGNKAMGKRAGLTDLVSWKETPRRTKSACKKNIFSHCSSLTLEPGLVLI